jgi:hypothetical protein
MADEKKFNANGFAQQQRDRLPGIVAEIEALFQTAELWAARMIHNPNTTSRNWQFDAAPSVSYP